MQVITNGLIDGLAIGVVALAFALVYLPTRVFHVALAGIYAASPFVVLMCLDHEIPWYGAFLMGLLAGLALSLACEVCNHRRLAHRRASNEIHLISSLGLFVLIEQCVAMAWGTEPKVLRTGLDSVLELGSVIVTRSQAITAITSLVALGTSLLVLWITPIGARLRGLADNGDELQLRGHDIYKLRSYAFAASGVLAACASINRAHDLGFSAHGSIGHVLVAVVAVIVGGRRSFIGPVLAGLCLGVVRAISVWLFSARWEAAITFLILAGFLLFRPQGLVGQWRRLDTQAT